MKQIDPAMAQRVWQRVQASLEKGAPAESAPLPSLPVYTVPPEAWREAAPARPARKYMRRPQPSQEPLAWPWLVLLWLLLHKCW